MLTITAGGVKRGEGECLFQLAYNLFPPQLEVYRQLPTLLKFCIRGMRTHGLDSVCR